MANQSELFCTDAARRVRLSWQAGGQVRPDGIPLAGKLGDVAMGVVATVERSVTTLCDMIAIAGGTFRMGSDKHYPEEAPVHRVTVDEFWMDRTPVTNRQFKEFVKLTRYVTFVYKWRHLIENSFGKLRDFKRIKGCMVSARAPPTSPP